MKKETSEDVKYVDCAPRFTTEQGLEIVDMNMICMRKEFGPEYTKAKKIGSVYDKEQLRRAIEARRAFIGRWYDLLLSDLYMLDWIAEKEGFDRAHVPGVISEFIIKIKGTKGTTRILVRGKPISPVFGDEIRDEIMRLAGEIHSVLPNAPDALKKTLAYQLECFFRGHGYETLEISHGTEYEV